MCGLAGLLDLSRSTADADLINEASAMAETLVHRGPDDADTWTDAEAGVGFGFRRLSIVDLTATGKQPMTSNDGRWVMMFNGEIYNHNDLRTDLTVEGCQFRGTSDTEVLLEAVARWGLESALDKLNGMFAIVLWDREQRELHLVRDRLGVKPLYWGRFGTSVIFASELKALRTSDRWTPALNPLAETAFLKLGYIPAPLSIYEGVSKLQPGQGVTIAHDGRMRDWSYWSLAETIRTAKQNPIDETDALYAFQECFEHAVSCRASADVPVGAFLSGGFDSTAVVAALVATGHGDVETFSIGFDDPKFDESGHAKEVAKHLGVQHSTFSLSDADVVQLAERMPTLYDEPFADSSQFPMTAVSAFAREKVTVALSGDGGDELFAGYTRHQWADQSWRRVAAQPHWVRRSAGLMAKAAPDLFLKLLPTNLRPNAGAEGVRWLSHLLSARDETELHERVVAIGDPTTAGTSAWFNDASRVTDDPVERMMYTDTMRYLPDDILVKLDRASMSASLEAREPFLDHNLVALAWSMPMSQKLESTIGKRVLRDYVYQHVPRNVMDRPKQGFSVPLGDWLRGPLNAYVQDHLHGLNAERVESNEKQRVRELQKIHQAADGNSGPELWAQVVLQAWRRHWCV